MAQLKAYNLNDPKSDRGDASGRFNQDFECSEDEEVTMIFGFEKNDAQQKLNNFPKCSRLVISPDLQADLGMEIGTSISVEHPWKEIKKEILEDHLPGKTKVQRQLKDKLKDMESGKLILVGYLPDQSTEEENVFAVFTDNRETNEARELIRRMELVERLWAAAAMKKKARVWHSRGSARDVANFIPQYRTNVVNVELQRIFSEKRADSYRFWMRQVEDARDGYVALVPKVFIHNIVRKSLDFGVQLRPRKLHKLQQTDPTFPTNAWSQYLYEIGHEQHTMTASTSTGPQLVPPAVTSEPDTKLPPESGTPVFASHHVVQLLDTLEFNQIDMYRNDYSIISRGKSIAKYETPLVEEKMCFMDRTTCANRKVSAVEWHPTKAGTFVASYVYQIPSIDAPSPSAKEDVVNRLVFEKCPVLAWNFDESLVPRLWFESPREVTALSFCPYDDRLLIGGLSSGQLLIWELTDAQLEHAGPRASTSKDKLPGHHQTESYRSEIKLLLGNATSASRITTTRIPSNPPDRRCTGRVVPEGVPEVSWHVRPVVISALERSTHRPITVVQWLPQNYHCAPTGHLRTKSPEEKLCRFLLTGAIDGTVCFWDLDLSVPAILLQVKEQSTIRSMEGPPRPREFTTDTGMARLNNVFHPTFRVRCETPIVALALDEPIATTDRSVPPTPAAAISAQPSTTGCRMSFITGNLMGGFYWGKWDGYEFDQGATVNEEPVRDRDAFAQVHNGPLLAIARNTFMPDVLLTVGGAVLALWTIDCRQSPILWRRKPAALTTCAWSHDRPSVFFVGLANGDFEIWDLQIHTSIACVALNLGEQILSIITQQQHGRCPAHKRHLAVADGNCNVRLLSIPAVFTEPRANERRRFRQLIRAELARKHEQNAWVLRYYEQNREQIEARLHAECEARELAERLEIEKQEHDDFLHRQTIEEAKKKALRDAEKRVDLSKRLEGRWRSRYYRALIRTMMARRQLSPELLAKQMHPERERRLYEVRKRATIGESVMVASDDYRRIQRALGARSSWAAEHNIYARGASGAQAQLRETVQTRFREELGDYRRVSWEAKEVLRVFRLPLELDSFASLVVKGRWRRQLVLFDDHDNRYHLQAYLEKLVFRGSGLKGGGVHGIGPSIIGDDSESTVINGSPDVGGCPGGGGNGGGGRGYSVGLHRARSVTFIDDVPAGATDEGQKGA